MDNPLKIERAVEDLATWLHADIEWKDVRAARKFVAAYLDNDIHKFRWEWDRKNMEPPEGYIILRQVRRTTKGERVILQLYGEQVVWRQTIEGDPSQVLPIEQALFTFELVPFGKNATYVYSQLRYEDSAPMQQYRDEVLKRIETEVATQEGRQHEQKPKDAAPKGAPSLASLEAGDPRAIEKKAKLREYLRFVLREKDPLTLTVAAGRVVLARTTLERYRETWPEIEKEIKEELTAQKVRKA